MNHFTDGPYTAYIGIDWADTKHDVHLQAAGCEQRVADRVDALSDMPES